MKFYNLFNSFPAENTLCRFCVSINNAAYLALETSACFRSINSPKWNGLSEGIQIWNFIRYCQINSTKGCSHTCPQKHDSRVPFCHPLTSPGCQHSLTFYSSDEEKHISLFSLDLTFHGYFSHMLQMFSCSFSFLMWLNFWCILPYIKF